MSYDLAVWEGPVPGSGEEAGDAYDDFQQALQDGEGEADPTPRMRRYVEALVARWPDIDQPGGEDSPWAEGPLILAVEGPFMVVSLLFSRAEEAVEVMAATAREHGLVCFDPQEWRLLP